MKLLRFFLLLGAVNIAWVFPTHAQNIKRQRIETKIEFQAQAKDEIAVANEILQFIAEGNDKMRAFTSFLVKADLVYEVRKTHKPEEYQLLMRIEGLDFEGDVAVRDFNLSSLLVPNGISFQFAGGANQTNTCLTKRKEKLLFDVSNPPQTSLFIICNKTLSTDDIKIEKPEFFYNKLGIERLKQFSNALEDYYNLEESTSLIHRKLDGLNPQDPWRIILDDFVVCEAEAIGQEMAASGLWKFTSIVQSDPQGVVERARAAIARSIDMRSEYNALLEELHQHFYHGAHKQLAENQVFKARDLLKQALRIHPVYFEANFQLVRMDADILRFDSAMARMQKVWNEHYPRNHYYEQSVALSDSIYSLWMAHVRKLIGNQHYTEAIDELTACFSICENIRYYDCGGAHRSLMAVARTGVFRSYLSVARRALNTDNLGFAETYLRQAIAYQQEHSMFIPSGAEAHEMFTSITAKYIDLFDRMLQRKEMGAAEIALGKARTLYSEYPCVGCEQRIQAGYYELERYAGISKPEVLPLPGLEKRDEVVQSTTQLSEDDVLKQILGFSAKEAEMNYRQNFEFARLLASEGQNAEALSYAEFASRIAHVHLLSKVSSSDSLVFVLASEKARTLLSVAHMDVWANRMTEANSAIDSLNVWFEKYSLHRNPLVVNRFESLKQKFEDKACENIKLEMEFLIYKATESQRMGDFSQSRERLREVLKQKQAILECGLSIDEAENMHKDIEKAALFHEMLMRLEERISDEQQVRNFIANYEQALNYKKLHEAGLKGQRLPAASAYVQKWIQPDAVMVFMNEMLNRQQALNAFFALKRLEVLGVSSQEVRKQQQQTGRMLKMHSNQEEVREALMSVERNPWFQALMRSYGKKGR